MMEQARLQIDKPEPPEDEKTKVPVTARAICNHFAEIYSEANGYACLFEVANGTGTHAHRNADAVVMNLWPSRGMQLIGYEFKVSRSDWLHELKQPEKAWPVMRYCDRWYLVAAPKVAKLEEIPLNWGFAEFNGKRLRVIKAAPPLTPEPWSRTFLAAMLRRPVRDIEALVSAKARERTEELEKKFNQRVEQSVAYRVRDSAKVMEKVEEIKRLTGIDLTSYHPTDEAAQALRFVMSERPFRHFAGYGAAFDAVQRAAQDMAKLAEQLQPFIERDSK